MIRFLKRNGLASLEELYFPDENIEWPEPWWGLEKNLDARLGIQKELNSEIGPKHPLWGLKPVVIGKTDANDDVIVHLEDGRFACVHLVWHGKIDQYPDKFPSVIFFESLARLQTYINEEADEYTLQTKPGTIAHYVRWTLLRSAGVGSVYTGLKEC